MPAPSTVTMRGTGAASAGGAGSAGGRHGAEDSAHRNVVNTLVSTLRMPTPGVEGSVKACVAADDGAAVRGAERAQRHAVAEVALQAPQPALLQALRREQEVDAEAATQAADGPEQVDEVGLGVEQLGELVDDHQQARQRRQVGPAGPGVDVVLARGQLAGGAQQLLAAAQLAPEGVVHAVDEGPVVGQVGDQPGDVGQLARGRRRRRRP